MKRIIWWCVMLLGLSAVQAQTYTASSGGHTMTVTITPTTTPKQWHYAVSWTGVGGFGRMVVHFDSNPFNHWELTSSRPAGSTSFTWSGGTATVFTGYIQFRYSNSIPEATTVTYDLGEWSNPNKITVSLRNTKNYPVTYEVRQGGSVVGQVTLQPGQALIQQFTAPSADPVTVWALVDGITKDGPSWVAVEGAVTTQQVSPSTITPTQSPPSGGVSIPEPDTPAVMPQAPDPQAPSHGGQPIWQASGLPADSLSNAVYREGVDKVVASLRASEPVEAFTFTGASEETSPFEKPAVLGVLGKLGDAPEMPTVGTAGSPNVVIPFSYGEIEFPAVIDLEQVETHASVWRLVASWVLGIMFWYGCVRLVRGAVSDQ